MIAPTQKSFSKRGFVVLSSTIRNREPNVNQMALFHYTFRELWQPMDNNSNEHIYTYKSINFASIFH